jgi:hypothetical protein
MTLEYVVKAFKVLFGRDNVISDKGEITVRVQYPGHGKLSSVCLTIEQAKFVVAHSISAKDLIDENYPADWPGGARHRSTISQPITSTAYRSKPANCHVTALFPAAWGTQLE